MSEYRGGTNILSEAKAIEVYDQYEQVYRSITEIEEAISSLKDTLYYDYDPDLYNSQKEFERDVESDIEELENLKEKIVSRITEAAYAAISDWLNKNKSWLGDNRNDISYIIYHNRSTGGTAWEALIETNYDDEAVELIDRMEIAQNRHQSTSYDAIDKRGMTNDQVAELRTDINRNIRG